MTAVTSAPPALGGGPQRAHLPDDAGRPAARHLPGRVRAPTVSGLRQRQSEALGEEEEYVEEAGRQRHVIVDRHEPVVTRSGMVGEERVEVLELTPAIDGLAGEVDVVARALELVARRREQVWLVGSLDAEHEHAPAGPPLRRPPQSPRLPAREGERVQGNIGGGGPRGRPNAGDIPARPGDEVIAPPGATRTPTTREFGATSNIDLTELMDRQVV